MARTLKEQVALVAGGTRGAGRGIAVEEAVARDPHFAASETPRFVGRAVAALAADPDVMERSGGAFASGELAEEYGFDHVDGSRPNWPAYFRENRGSLHRSRLGSRPADRGSAPG